MSKTKIGIFLSLLLLVGLTSCGEKKTNSKLMLNEVLIDNQSNFQDDYGLHSAWIEVFNKSYGSADLAGCLLNIVVATRGRQKFIHTFETLCLQMQGDSRTVFFCH